MVKDLIINLKNEGTTILFSTHRMDNIEELCDKLAIIHNGEKILDGKINDIRQQFFNQEYIIEFTDNEMNSGDTDINGFNIVQTKMNSFNRKEITVKLNDNQTPQELYRSFGNSTSIIGFREKMPTIHQIFVNQVTSKN
jgi:ABC-2 type transport system ATP-binding protein